MRRGLQLACAAATGLLAAIASAQAPAEQPPCHEAFESAQMSRQTGKLLESREHLRACTAPGCNDVLRSECGVWLNEVEKDIPSLTLTIVDRNGSAVIGATVQLDGRMLSEREMGRAIEVDPGTHELVVQAYGARASKSITATQGHKNHAVTIELPWGKKTGEAEQPRPLPKPLPVAVTKDEKRYTSLETAGIVLAAAGGLGLVAFGVLAYLGSNEESQLRRDECAPRCDTSDVDVVRRLYTAADISLVAGGVIAATGIIMYLAAPSADEPTEPAATIELSPAAATLKVRFP